MAKPLPSLGSLISTPAGGLPSTASLVGPQGLPSLDDVIGNPPVQLVKQAPKKGGGGFLNTLAKVGETALDVGTLGASSALGAPSGYLPSSAPVTHAAGQVLTGAADVTASIGTGVYKLGKDAVAPGTHPSWGQLAHDWVNPQSWFSSKSINADPFAKDVVAMGKGTVTPLLHPGRDPIQTVISVATLASLGAGALSRAAYAADALGAARTGEALTLDGEAATAGQVVRAGVKTLNPLRKPPAPTRLIHVPQTKLKALPDGVEGPQAIETVRTPVQLQASGAALGRGFQTVVDKAMQKGLDRGAASGSYGTFGKIGLGRAAKADAETARIAGNLRAVPASVAHDAGGRGLVKFLTGRSAFGKGVTQDEGQLALLFRSYNVTGKDMADYWAGQAARGVNPEHTAAMSKLAGSIEQKGLLRVNPAGNVEVAADRFPKLGAAETATVGAQAPREAIVAQSGRMTPEGMQSRLDLVGRIVAGGKYVKPTPGKLGVPSQGMVKMQAYTSRLEALHGRAAAKAAKAEFSVAQQKIIGDARPATEDEATIQTHLDAVNKRITAARKLLPVDSEEVKVLVRTKTAWQKLEIARGDMEKAASGLEGAKVPTPDEIAARVQELRTQIAEGRGERDPNLLKMLRKMEAQANQLRRDRKAAEQGSRIVPSGVAYTSSGARLEPKGYARAENLGAALSVAKDRLQQMEAAAERRQTPTGIVGGEGSRPGQGFVSLKTSVKAPLQTRIAQARGKLIPRTKPLNVGKTATGKGIEEGRVPKSTTGTVAQDLHDALRVFNTEELRGMSARRGSDVRQSTDDVLLADPAAEKTADVPEVYKQLLGLKEDATLTPDQEVGVSKALQALLDDHIQVRDDAIGARAPAGWKWVSRQLLPDSLTSVATARGGFEKTADTINSTVTGATVYFKFGHIPTRVFTNLTTNVMEGSAAPLEVLKSFQMVKQLGGMNNLLVRKLDALTGGHGYTALPHAGTSVAAKAAGHGARWYARKIDAPFRLNSILYNLRNAGFDTPEKIREAVARLEDPARHGMDAAKASRLDWAVRRSNRASIMYDGMSADERRRVARYLWFYPWTKGAVRFAGHTLVEHPVKAAVGAQIGAQGAQYRKGVLGDVPSYELGLTPLSGGSSPLTANFSSFTPYSTVGSVADIVRSPQNVVQQLNPVYAGLAAAVTDALEKKGTGKALRDFAGQATAPTPEAQAITAALHPQGKGLFPTSTRYLFGKSWQASFARAAGGAGFPRPVNKAKLNQDAAKKHMKKHTFTVYGG